MWWRRPFLAALVLASLSRAAAAPASCPRRLVDAAGTHLLGNVSLYDGPPGGLADLIPVPDGAMARWDVDRRDDPYLVCHYRNTSRMVTLHETGARVCEAGDRPARAGCR